MVRAQRYLTKLSFPIARLYWLSLEAAAPGEDPVVAVSRLRGRVLLLAGGRDPYVPLAHARDLARAAGVELVTFPGVGHRNLHRVVRDAWEQVVANWLDAR